IEQLIVGRSRVHLEIAGVDDDAERRGDGQRHRAHNRVRNVNKLDLERADLHDLLRLNADELRLLLQVVFLQAALHQAQSEGRAVDRDIDLLQKIRNGSDVVFVAMRQNDGQNLFLV